MQADYVARNNLFINENPNEDARILELPVRDIRDYHTAVFQTKSLPPEAWTAYAPTVLAPDEDAAWETILASGDNWPQIIAYGGTEAITQGWNWLLNNGQEGNAISGTWLKAMFYDGDNFAPVIPGASIEAYELTLGSGKIVSGGTDENDTRSITQAGTLLGYDGNDSLTGSDGSDLIFGGVATTR